MSDAAETLWVKVDDGEGSEEDYYVDETFELSWNAVEYTYAVLISEEQFPAYSRGEMDRIIPDVMRYCDNNNSLESIEDEDEKTFVIETIAAHYAAIDEADSES